MVETLKRNAETLRFLHRKPVYAKGVIQHADDQLLDCLRVCCKNILDGNVPLSPTQKARLNRHKNILRSLIKPGLPRAHKKALIQKGGFLPALLAPILAIAGPLFKSLLG